MGKTTKISYADSTISPLVGCDGCELLDLTRGIKLCYAHALVTRYAGVRGWPKDFFQPEFFPGRLEQAIRWKDLTDTDRPDKPWLNGYPRIVFLGDLADIFAKNAPDPREWLVPMIPRMAEKHIWLFLTKRPRRMAQFFEQVGYVPRNFWLGTTITS